MFHWSRTWQLLLKSGTKSSRMESWKVHLLRASAFQLQLSTNALSCNSWNNWVTWLSFPTLPGILSKCSNALHPRNQCNEYWYCRSRATISSSRWTPHLKKNNFSSKINLKIVARWRYTLFEKSNFCPKIQFWQNPNIFTSFLPNFFFDHFSREIRVVNS